MKAGMTYFFSWSRSDVMPGGHFMLPLVRAGSAGTHFLSSLHCFSLATPGTGHWWTGRYVGESECTGKYEERVFMVLLMCHASGVVLSKSWGTIAHESTCMVTRFLSPLRYFESATLSTDTQENRCFWASLRARGEWKKGYWWWIRA